MFLGRLLLAAIKTLSENLSSGLGERLLQSHRSLERSDTGTDLPVPSRSQWEYRTVTPLRDLSPWKSFLRDV